MKKFINGSLFLFSLGFIFYLTHIMISHEFTPRENVMLTIFLCIASVIATWIVTHIYSKSQYKQDIAAAQEQYRTNLRTYALKAAEKVNNLSSELNKLSAYLQEELDYIDYHSLDDELLAKEERIESAIHIINTLKSVNDTSLSDWRGVIEDELDQQREDREEKEAALQSVIERAESVIENQRQGFLGSQKSTELLRAEIEHLKRDIRVALSQLSGTSVPKRIAHKELKQAVENHCPSCGVANSYRQRPRAKSVKAFNCEHCGKKLLSLYSEDGKFILLLRKNELIKYQCPSCQKENDIELDNFPSSFSVSSCKECGVIARIVRKVDGIDVTAIAIQKPEVTSTLSDEIINHIREKLPPQPWPDGIHKVIAKELGLQPKLVSSAIYELIYKRKVFFPQVDGTVYKPDVIDT